MAQGSVLSTVSQVMLCTDRARATADLMQVYFEKLDQQLPEVCSDTMESALATIIKELDAIEQLLSE
ncbi:MAG: hypothetical protein ABFS22_05505 [Pseudomonadota bacterium]